MKQQWLEMCRKLSAQPATFYSGARKIIRPVTWTFPSIKDDLSLADCGFTSNKMRMLERNYLHQESIDAALDLWSKRLAKRKYGSVGFTTYNHFRKGNVTGASPRGSVMGPCIQSVCISLLDDNSQSVDIFYRTTELFKKFPADLVFVRDVLLKPFELERPTVTFHFANVTCHPMYWVTTAPHLESPAGVLDYLKRKDKYFFNWCVKWTARYLCPEYFRGIEKFAQAMRVRKDALERIDKKVLKQLQQYLRQNHPGYRGDKNETDDEEE